MLDHSIVYQCNCSGMQMFAINEISQFNYPFARISHSLNNQCTILCQTKYSTNKRTIIQRRYELFVDYVNRE